VKPVVIVDPPRADHAVVAALGELGVATVHEAAGRTGLLGAGLRPAWAGARAAGTAVTVLCGPGDNLMLHAAVEQARPGDLLVVTTTSPSSDGFVGELITTSFATRGVSGLVTTTGVRDVAAITAARFPVWSRFVSAQGTGKAIAGAVNLPVAIGGTVIRPGDAVVADDDGVVCIPREQAAQVAADGRLRARREDEARDAFARGELGLDRYHLRPVLERLGVTYVRADRSGPASRSVPADHSGPAGRSVPADYSGPAGRSVPADHSGPASHSRPADHNQPTGHAHPAGHGES
jgi:4-hydroxy-4-methyl-2-oxoglutarate aldolase